MNDLEPLPAPGDFLRSVLQERGMTQLDLAFILGLKQQAINGLFVGRRGISAAMAMALGDALGVAPEYLLRLQKAAEARAELARAKSPSPAIARKAQLLKVYPVRDMVRRGWLREGTDVEAEMARFFGVSSMDDVPHIAHAAKKTAYEDVPAPQLAWLFRVRQIASRLIVPAYSESALRASIPKLRSLLLEPDHVSRAPRILSECGVRFVAVETITGSKIDGVTLWLDANSPVIGMSIRFDRVDNFWFVLRHEIEHVLRRDGMERPMCDVDLQVDSASADASVPDAERAANDAASDFCVSRSKMESWVLRKGPFFSERDLLGFAKVQQIHPGIVAGQLRNRTKNYKIFGKYLAKVLSSITATAVVDGWGETYPA